MRKDHWSSTVHFHLLCRFLFAFSVLSSVSLIFWSQSSASCNGEAALNPEKRNESFHLLAFPSALNQLSFSAKPPRRLLKVALFVKRWPHRNLAGGLERHALTLHLALARRGHEIHVFTTKSNATYPRHNDAAMSFHQTPPSPAGYLNQALAWEQFQTENATGRPFDVIHSESVGLLHGRARNISNLAASWHGIAYETIHSDVVQDLLRGPDEPRRPDRASLVIGLAGRLVKDKGHPLMFEALKQVFGEEERFQRDVFVLVAGDGPWGNRYKELGRNIIVLGPLEQSELAKFYNSLDVYLNPTLRAQGLDHTFIEAMLSGVAIAGTRFASITGSLIVGSNVGYTFLPTVESLKESLYKIMKDGKQVLSKKGEVARSRALHLFTATKMAAAYERLFQCISKEQWQFSQG